MALGWPHGQSPGRSPGYRGEAAGLVEAAAPGFPATSVAARSAGALHGCSAQADADPSTGRMGQDDAARRLVCLGGEDAVFAWLALDRGDNDSVRFWTYLIEAVRSQQPAIGTESLPMLRVPRVDIVAEVLPALCAELMAESSELVLVLDDYHLVTNPEVDEGLAYFVDHLPRTLELVLASRTEPPLPLARMRAGGDLVEIDAEKLSFSEDEADLLLNELNGLGLDYQAVLRLRDRTEGWAAGLYLAALTLRGRPDPAAFIQDFAGDDRHVVDYLSTEVLVGQPEETRTFLLQTSILDRFCASLCDAVTQRHDSRRILRGLEASNFFLVPLDTKREWYRYHHLFGELLRHELSAGRVTKRPSPERRIPKRRSTASSGLRLASRVRFGVRRHPPRDRRRRGRRCVRDDPQPLAGGA